MENSESCNRLLKNTAKRLLAPLPTRQSNTYPNGKLDLEQKLNDAKSSIQQEHENALVYTTITPTRTYFLTPRRLGSNDNA
jgi:hypothetical protein